MFDPRVQFSTENDKENARVVWCTTNVQWALDAISNGLPLKRGASPFYKNNILIRKADLNFEFTAEELSEFIKCKLDILHFADSYCHLVTESGRTEQIKLRKYQRRLLRAMQTKKFVIILSGRQVGKTTTTAIFLLWKLIFHKEEAIALLGDKASTAVENLNKLKNIMFNLPFFLKPGIVGINNGSMMCDNGSRIFTGPCTKSSLVGKTLTCLYIDELDIPLPNQSKELVEYALPTIAALTNGQAIFSSTPSVGGIFKTLLLGAQEGTNAFHAEQINWWEVPGRDLKWKQETLKMYGKDAFNTQFNCRFLTSTRTIFNEDFIEQLERDKKKYVKYSKLYDDSSKFDVLNIAFDFINASGRLNVAEDEPIEYFTIKKSAKNLNFKEDFFVITVDIAEGIGNDDTVFNVFRLNADLKQVDVNKKDSVEFDDPMDAFVDDDVAIFDDVFEDYLIHAEQVAIFRSNKHGTKTAAYFLRALATKLFNTERLKISIEYNKYGEAFINYMTSENTKLESVDVEVLARTTVGDRQKVGVHLSSATKKIYVPLAKADLETGRIDITDSMSIQQLTYFGTTKNGSYAAAQGFKDDIVLTIVNLSAFIEKTNEDYIAFVEELIESKFDFSSEDDYW
jgi:hypothetical protein